MTVTTAVSPRFSPSTSIPGFRHIGPRTSLYTPSTAVVGQLVIICTWLGASKKVIAKYVALYQLITPGAKILLIESNVPILVSSVRFIFSLMPWISGGPNWPWHSSVS